MTRSNQKCIYLFCNEATGETSSRRLQSATELLTPLGQILGNKKKKNYDKTLVV